MTNLEKALGDRLNSHIGEVRKVLKNTGASSEEVEILTENLYDHAFSKAESLLDKYSAEEAAERTLAGLQPAESYGENSVLASQDAEGSGISVKTILGVVSVLLMGGSLALSAFLAEKIMFDVHQSGAVFLFGQILAFGIGIAALPSLLGRAGALCSAFMLLFLITGFLWKFFSGTG
ncbi:MAG: hypothetical protein ACRBBN_13420 [Methyloligellaceae bacterium]